MWVRLSNYTDDWLFSGVSQGNGALARLVRVLRYPYAVLRDLAGGQLNLRAMVLVYATLLSLIPLLAFSFAILRALNVHRDLQPLIHELFLPLGDTAATELTQQVMTFAENVQAGLVGSVGFAVLLWTLIGTVKKVEDSFNYVWRVQVARSFTRRIAEYVGLLIAGPVLLVSVIGLSTLALDSFALRALAQLPLFAQFTQWALDLAPFAIVSGCFVALYMVIPNTRVQLMPALIGAVVAGALWVATGKLFTQLVIYSARLTIVYAGFAIAIAALVWTYLGWLILLAGAQLSFYIQNPRYLRAGVVSLRLSGQETERLALNIMYLVGKAHLTGTALCSVDGLAREFGLPGLSVAQVVDSLEAAGLVVESSDEQLFPARDVAGIALTDILGAVRLRGRDHPLVGRHCLPPVERLLGSLESAWRERCGARTLKELIEEA